MSSYNSKSPPSPAKSSSFLSARDLWSKRLKSEKSSSTTKSTSVRDQLSERSLATSFPFSPKKRIQKVVSTHNIPPSRRSSSHEITKAATTATKSHSSSPHRSASSLGIYSVSSPKPTALLDRCLSLPNKKSVSFDPNDSIREIERREYVSDQHAGIWWTEADYMEMRKSWETILFLLESGKPVCEETLSARGLHKRTERGAWDLFEIQRDAQNAVFSAQEQQKKQNAKNPEEIAALYTVITAPYREAAYQQGLEDAKEARQITKKLKKRKKKNKAASSPDDAASPKPTSSPKLSSLKSSSSKSSPRKSLSPKASTKSTVKKKKKNSSKGLPPACFNDSFKALGTLSSKSTTTSDTKLFVGSVSFNPDIEFIKNVKVKDMKKAIDRRWLSKDDLARIEADFQAVISKLEAGTEVDETLESARGLEMSTEAGAAELLERRSLALRTVLDRQKQQELPEAIAKAYHDATKHSRKQAFKLGRSDRKEAKEARIRRRSIDQGSSMRSIESDIPSVVSADDMSVEPEFVRLARKRQQNRRSSHNDISRFITLQVVEEPTENNEELDQDDVVSNEVKEESNIEAVVANEALDELSTGESNPQLDMLPGTVEMADKQVIVGPETTDIEDKASPKTTTNGAEGVPDDADKEMDAAKDQKETIHPPRRRRLSSSHAPSLRVKDLDSNEKEEKNNPSLLWIRQKELLKSVGRQSPRQVNRERSTHWKRNRSVISLDELKDKLKSTVADGSVESTTIPTIHSCPEPVTASDEKAVDPTTTAIERSNEPNKSDDFSKTEQLPLQIRNVGTTRNVSDITESSAAISQARKTANDSTALEIMQRVVATTAEDVECNQSFHSAWSTDDDHCDDRTASAEEACSHTSKDSSKSSWQQAFQKFAGNNTERSKPKRFSRSLPGSVSSFHSEQSRGAVSLPAVSNEVTDCNKSKDESAVLVAERITTLSVEEEIENEVAEDIECANTEEEKSTNESKPPPIEDLAVIDDDQEAGSVPSKTDNTVQGPCGTVSDGEAAHNHGTSSDSFGRLEKPFPTPTECEDPTAKDRLLFQQDDSSSPICATLEGIDDSPQQVLETETRTNHKGANLCDTDLLISLPKSEATQSENCDVHKMANAKESQQISRKELETEDSNSPVTSLLQSLNPPLLDNVGKIEDQSSIISCSKAGETGLPKSNELLAEGNGSIDETVAVDKSHVTEYEVVDVTVEKANGADTSDHLLHPPSNDIPRSLHKECTAISSSDTDANTRFAICHETRPPTHDTLPTSSCSKDEVNTEASHDSVKDEPSNTEENPPEPTILQPTAELKSTNLAPESSPESVQLESRCHTDASASNPVELLPDRNSTDGRNDGVPTQVAQTSQHLVDSGLRLEGKANKTQVSLDTQADTSPNDVICDASDIVSVAPPFAPSSTPLPSTNIQLRESTSETEDSPISTEELPERHQLFTQPSPGPHSPNVQQLDDPPFEEIPPSMEQDEEFVWLKVRASDLVKVPTGDGRVVYLVFDPTRLSEA